MEFLWLENQVCKIKGDIFTNFVATIDSQAGLDVEGEVRGVQPVAVCNLAATTEILHTVFLSY